MKQFCIIILFFFLIIPANYLNAKYRISCLEVESALAPPTATITGNATVCKNAASPVVTFTGSGGTAPYTFTYKINGGATQTITTTTGKGDSVTVLVPTTTTGTFEYNLLSVSDASLPIAEITQNGMATVIVNPLPDASLGGTGSGTAFNGIPAFRICSNITSLFTFTNTSSTTSTLNSNYIIDWGDGTPNFNSTTWNTITHTYAVGYWNLVYTIQSTNGCEIIKKYVVFVGSNPAVSLGNPGNTDICNSTQLTFPISGTENNPSGTTYTVSFNDGSTPITFNHPPPTTISHTFFKTSCGVTSSDGTNSYPNSFRANIVAQNPCGTSAVGVVPIYVSTPPVADFIIPSNGCTNTSICLNNTTTGGFENNGNSNSCNTNPKFVWIISPSTGYTVVNGSIGNDFGSIDPNLWLSGSSPLCLNFSQGGTYTITIKTANRCGSVVTKTKTICIEPPLTPTFTLNNSLDCSPKAITATNTTVTTNSCTTPTYVWNVTHTPAYCGTSIAAIPNPTTTNASYNFSEPGTYIIKLTATNSCGSFSSSQTVIVKKPPTVTINTIANVCQTGNSTAINPTATVPVCANATYAWSFPGGTPATSTLAVPGPISYSTAGTYTVSLSVTNECGTTIATDRTFTINPSPTIIGNLFSCVGFTSQLTGSATAATTVPWASSNTAVATVSSTGLVTAVSGGTTTITYTNSNNCKTTELFTVNPAPTITPLASSTVCLGGTPTVLTFTISGATGTPTYQWYSNTTNSNTGGTIIAGETNTTFNPPASIAGTFYYYCIITLPTGGCSNIKTNVATVVILPNATINTQPTTTQNLCVGVTIPSPLTISYSGGTGTPAYQWYSSITNSNSGGTPITGANSATYLPPVFVVANSYYYYATVSLNGNGCLPAKSNVAEVIVLADPTISVQPTATQTLCQNATPTNLDVTPIGGNGTFSYQWYSNSTNTNTGGALIAGATSNSYTPLTTTIGTKYYYCVVSQNSTSGCSVNSATAAIIVIAAPTITQPSSSTVCQGGSLAPLSIMVSGATGTPQYQWYFNVANNNTTGTAISGATNATYNPPNSIVGTVYYYCVVTLPSGGCSSITSNTATIIINAGATINTHPTPTQNLCVGATITTPLTVTYSGGSGAVSYQWYSNNTNSNVGGTLISGATGANYTPTAFVTNGNYYYYVSLSFSGNGCGPITSDPAEIVIVNDPTVSLQPLVSQTLCQGATPTTLSVAATGGIGTYSYQWFSSVSNSNAGGILISGETNNTFTPPTTSVGTRYYYCLITQTGIGCNVTSLTAEVIVNLAPEITNQPQSSIVCLGKIPTLLSVNYINGVGIPAYQWYSNTANSIVGSTPISGATSATYNPQNTSLGTTYYYCIITLPTGGCSSLTSAIVAVTINSNPVIANKTALICSGNPFTILPINSGSEIVPLGTTYTWSNPIISPAGSINGALAQNVPQTEISQSLINTTTSAATVTYNVTPLSGNCVGVNFVIVVTVNPAISANVTSNNSTCFGANNGTIQTNITGGIPFSSGVPYQISWTGPNGFTSSQPSISSLAPGDYSLSVTDAGGCPINKMYTITEPADIIITTDLEKDITCFGNSNGAIQITVTGGTLNYKYTWTKNGIAFSNTEDLSNLSPGTYVVTVSDANNCGSKTASFTITEPTILAVNLVSKTDIQCFGFLTGAISVNVVGGTPSVAGYNFEWSGPNGFTSTNQNLTGIPAGDYNLKVTDDAGCVANLAVTLIQNPEITITALTTPIICYEDNNGAIRLTISGGVSPYSVLWTNLGTGIFQDNLSAGDYTATITDALNCVSSITVNIPSPPIFTINPVVKNISCFGANNGSINLNLIGGITPIKLTWSDGSTAGTTRNNLKPGSYTVTIVDSKPCTITRTFVIQEPQLLVLSANLTQALDCNDANTGAINLLVSGGSAPFTYAWSNGATTEDLINIPAGNYLVTVTDSRGCVQTAQYSINRPPPIVIGVETKTDFNCETKYVKQTFIAKVTGGVPPYQILWSSGTVSGANNEMMTTNQNGAVLLNVTDAIGCKANTTFNVDLPILGSASFSSNSIAYSTFGTYSINDPIQFTNTATGDFIGVAWDFGDGTFSTELNPVHIFINPKDYVVTQTVAYPLGCVYVQKITFIVGKGYVLVAPTAFTPNNDKINDTFRPVTQGLKNVRLDVYDTWGSMIYSESGDSLRGWDGKLKGINAENGNYFCRVSGETFYGTIVNENHPFVLIK